jgi:succinoglycan biosynthesis transport protein ExoP
LVHAAPSAFEDALYVLRKRAFRIVAITLLAGMAAYLYGVGTGPIYTATGRLMVSPVQPGLDPGEAARNEAEILRDPSLIRGALPLLWASLPPPPQGVAGRVKALGTWWQRRLAALGLGSTATRDALFEARLEHALSVAAVPGTDVVVLQFSWPDQGFPAAVLNALLREQQRLASGNAQAAEAAARAQSRLVDAQSQLAHIESRIASLPLLAGAPPDPGAIEREKDRVDSRLAATRADADALRLERDLAAKKLEAADKAYQGGGWVDNPDAPANAAGTPALDQSFTDLLEKRGQLLMHLPPDSPKVKALDSQISAAREHAYQAVKQVLGTRLHAVDTRLAALSAMNETDDAALRALDDRLVELEALLGSRQEATSHVSEARRQLDVMQRQNDAAMHDAAGLRVLSHASVPAEPDFPSPPFILWASTLAGFCLGIWSAILAERYRITIDRPQDIVRLLNIPVLAAVPELR